MKLNTLDWQKPTSAQVPISKTAATYNTTGVDTLSTDELLISLHVGAMATGATLIAKLQECETVGGTYVDVTSSPTNTLSVTEGVGTPEDTLYLWEVDSRLRMRFVRLNYVVGVGAIVLGITKSITKPNERPVTHTATVVAQVRNEA